MIRNLTYKLRHTGLLILTLGLWIWACSPSKNIVDEQFNSIDESGWAWDSVTEFQFNIEDTTTYYLLSCGLRIRSNYTYSNIWLLYELEGPGLQQQNQFEIELSDQTGRWKGQGKSNLITFLQPFLDRIPFKAGTYTLRIKQNMRDEQLKGVSDVGFQLVRGKPIL